MKDYFKLGTTESVASARRIFERGAASALIIIPKGFQTALLEERKTELLLYKNPIQTFSPDIVESVLEMATAVGNGFIAQARDPVSHIRKLIEESREPREEEVAEISRAFYQSGQRFARLGALQDISVEVQRPGGEVKSGLGSSPREFFA